MTELVIRPLEMRDLSAVETIEERSYATPWKEGSPCLCSCWSEP